jgi:uncharacterized protein DUF5681
VQDLARPGTFQPGQSGNPKGRPPNSQAIGTLARKYGPACVDKLAQFAGLVPGEIGESHGVQLAAMKELLDRGYGKAVQHIDGDSAADHWALHLLAAKAIAQELRAERENPLAIEGTVQDVADETTVDLSKPALE